MFTKNYLDFQKTRFTVTSNDAVVKLIDCTGTSRDARACAFWIADIGSWMAKGRCRTWSDVITKLSGNSYTGVYFGSGSTPASKDDYKLENPITSGLSITNGSGVALTDHGGGKYTASADFILRNTSDAEITISEIGVFTPITTDRNIAPDDSGQLYMALMERTVLDAPIVIPVGEAKVITYKIIFNQTSV